jgi:O-antigen chain-terminating methyltransferase
MVINSRSWKLTYPLRFIGKTVKWFIRGSIAWLTFSPTSRPRRTIKNLGVIFLGLKS